jgi:hypothetical protein
MMDREFSLLYNPLFMKWSIIVREPDDDAWYVYIEGLEGKETALETVGALNLAEEIKRENATNAS